MNVNATESIIAEVLTAGLEPGMNPDIEDLACKIADALRAADFLSDKPLPYVEHHERHDDAFAHGCAYCDWEFDNNKMFIWPEDRL